MGSEDNDRELERLRAEHKMAFEAVGDVVKANDILRAENEKLKSRILELEMFEQFAGEDNGTIERLREALNGWQEWWAGPREGKRPDFAELIYRRAAAALGETDE